MHIFLEKKRNWLSCIFFMLLLYQKPDCVIVLDPEFNPVLYNWTHDLLLTDLRSVLLVLWIIVVCLGAWIHRLRTLNISDWCVCRVQAWRSYIYTGYLHLTLFLPYLWLVCQTVTQMESINDVFTLNIQKQFHQVVVLKVIFLVNIKWYVGSIS